MIFRENAQADARQLTHQMRLAQQKHGHSALQVDSQGARSYGTVLLEQLPDGRWLGNVTRYSTTTSKHQNWLGVRQYADVLVDEVPQGTRSMIPAYDRYRAEGGEAVSGEQRRFYVGWDGREYEMLE